MKKLFIAFLVSLVPLAVYSAESETKKVCVEKRDAKGNVVKKADGTVAQDCKEIKVHKKLEGTKVPDKK